MPYWTLAPVDNGAADWRHAVTVPGQPWPLHRLTGRQRRMLRYLLAYRDERAASPTLRQIADACGFWSVSTAGYHLDKLERAGWVRRRFDRRGAVQIIEPGDQRVVCEPLPMPAPA
jgi:hypothetical protein